MSQIKNKLQDVPQKPGVYKFLATDGAVLYVGKAKNLRARLSQYVNGSDTRAQLPFLMAETTNFDYIVVQNELESLFLENTLIKEYLPPYNIMLRDDKNYAFIKLDYGTEIPQLTYVRQVDEKSRPNEKFFGPYSSTKKISQTLDLIRRVFHFCSNKEVGKRPCFYYFLHRCPGVCIGLMPLDEYNQHLQKITLFLAGQTAPIKKQLTAEMKTAARKKQFETAARLRDEFLAIQVLEEKQLTILTKKVSWDLLSVHSDALSASVNVFKVREGKLKDKENFIYQNLLIIPEAEREASVLQTFTEMYYGQATDLPKEIFTQVDLPNKDLLGQLLRSRSKTKIIVSTPTRGQKLKLISMGQTNAKEHLLKWQRSQASNADLAQETLAELKKLLKLPSLPRRIEGYDISNTQGTNPVGSMVVAKDGLPAKSEYRKFKITGKQTPDDFAMMREMLERRLVRVDKESVPSSMRKGGPKGRDGNNHLKQGDNKNHLVSAEGGATPPHPPASRQGEEFWPTPDLIVIDGGKGQLGVAVEVLR
ncbi:MAG TPA: excinuclease ABC subunit UvrC, partial [Candidatus Doudnabacteria bacterium]|nr:excinuclease ABC subunit UvrC [Candidatus Doudnabacteria bacterium]